MSYSVPRTVATALGVCTSKLGGEPATTRTSERTTPPSKLNDVRIRLPPETR